MDAIVSVASKTGIIRRTRDAGTKLVYVQFRYNLQCGLASLHRMALQSIQIAPFPQGHEQRYAALILNILDEKGMIHSRSMRLIGLPYLSRYLLCIVSSLGLVVVAASPGYALDKVRLQLRFDHQFQFAGYYAAQWQGYYRQAGLEVEILPGVRSNHSMVDVTDMVRRGAAEFGIGAGDILMAIDQGTPLMVLASILQQSPVELFARAATKLTSPADLTRLRVLAEPNPLVRAEVIAMLHAEGIRLEDVPFIPFDKRLSVMGRIDAIMQGEVDVIPDGESNIEILPGYALSIPWYAHERGIKLNSLKPAAYGVDFYGDSLFTTTELVEQDPDLVQRFRDASLKGWEYAMTHQDEIIDQIVDELPRQLPVSNLRDYNVYLAAKMRSLMHYPIIQIGHINPDRWRRMYETLFAAGVLHNRQPEAEFIFQPERIQQERLRAWLTYALEAAVAIIFLIVLLSILSLIRAKRRAEENERRYKTLFDNSPLSIWEEDFSAAKQYLDELLADSSLNVRELLDSRPDVVEECARRVRIISVNNATLSLFKAEATDDLISALPATFTAESFEVFREELICLKEGHSNFQNEALVKSLKGDKIYVDLRLSVLPSARLQWERVVIMMTDITARRHAETLLNRYKIMISTTADLMAYVTKDYRYLTANEGYCEAFLKDKDDIIGMHVSEVLGEDLFQQKIKPNMDRCLAGEHVNYELTMQFPARGLRVMHVTYYPIFAESGLIEGLMVHLHDLTDIKKLENELVGYRDNLEQLVIDRTLKLTYAMNELEAFSYAVSHDLRAPLRSITGFSMALLEGYKDQLDQKGRDYLARINKNTHKMGEQIDGLLSLSRIGRGDLKYSFIDISAIALDLVDKYQQVYREIPTTFSVQSGIELYGDRHLIEIALDNLIGNAFKFSSRAEHPQIDIGWVEWEGQKTLFVKDNGVGFEMEYSHKLFAVFQRLHSDFEGSGIGLATVQRVVLRHGGKLWADSAPGMGATFYLNLPTVDQVAALEAAGGG